MNVLNIGSSGYLVELLQSILKKLNIYTGNIDGIFGTITYLSVIEFQKDNNLMQDGIVGEKTWDALFPYLYGFVTYKIQKGDTVHKLANKYNSTVNSILFANPEIEIDNLTIGKNIIIPFENIVPTNVSYVYDILSMNIYSLKKVFPFITIGSVGKSVMGKDIPYIKIGKGKKEVFYSGGIHANEWITSLLLIKFIEDYCKAFVNNSTLSDKNIHEIFNETTLYIVPMINPDGIDLVTNNLNINSGAYKNAKYISDNFPDIIFPNDWKANILGVDLNLQFPLNWDKAKEINFEAGYIKPAPRQYVGTGPLTQIEAINLYNFTLKHCFNLVLSFHSQGEVIYWNDLGLDIPNSKEIGEKLAQISEYTLEEPPYESSFAGYRDWFVSKYKKPGYTIEVGSGENPLPISQFDEIYTRVIGILILGTIL